MDEFDALILEAIQKDTRLTAAGLAEQVGLSPDACRKRLVRLRRLGMVEADIAVLNPAMLGRDLFLIVEVKLEQERKTDLDHFKQRMMEAPQVMQCYYVTGAFDFIIIMTARNMKEYEEFTETQFFEESNVTSFTTNVVMDRVKTGFYIPVVSE